MAKPELKYISIDAISVGQRFRQEYALDDLIESIREKGIIQPITVAPRSDNRYDLIAGGRRLKAAKELEHTEIPALVREVEDEIDLREIELLENLERKDMTWAERVEATKNLDTLMREKYGDLKSGKNKGWSIRQTAKMLDKSAGGVHRHLELAKYMEQIPDLRKQKTEDDAVKLLRKIKEAMTVKQALTQRKERSSGSKEEVAEKEEGLRNLRSEFGYPVVTIALAAENHFNIGDAFDGLDELIQMGKDRGSKVPIGLVEVDPPYGISLKEKKTAKSKALDYYEEVEADEYPEFLKKICTKIYEATPDRVRVIFWFGQEWQREVRNALSDAGFTVDPIPGVWYKKSGQTNNPELFLARAYETFFIAWKGKAPMLRQRGRSNVFEFTGVSGSKKYHPTQRPIELMQEILRTFAWPGQIVLVPFLGSGATIIAAYRESMSSFGWELNEENKEPFLARVEQDIEEYLIPMCQRAAQENSDGSDDEAEEN